MEAISRWIRGNRTVRCRRLAGLALRSGAAVVLILQIVYTPIHLAMEPHSEEEAGRGLGLLASGAAVLGEENHHDDHARHSAAQHELKVVRPERAPTPELVLAAEVEAPSVEKECAHSPGYHFSGLSPPELPRSWQFVFRAALPVRAPSSLS